MVILISGATHTGKTALAQRMLEKYKFPYLSADHLKIGLIRSGYTDLTPEDDDKLTQYLWPVIKEIIKTAIENNQNLIIEGCYIPFDWQRYFDTEYLYHIDFYCIIMTENYIENNYDNINKYACIIENRLDHELCTKEFLLNENKKNLLLCKKYKFKYILIDKEYECDINLDIMKKKGSDI